MGNLACPVEGGDDLRVIASLPAWRNTSGDGCLYIECGSGTGWRGARDMTLRVSQTAAAVTTQQDVFASPGDINGTASVVQMRPLPSLEDLEALRCAVS